MHSARKQRKNSLLCSRNSLIRSRYHFINVGRYQFHADHFIRWEIKKKGTYGRTWRKRKKGSGTHWKLVKDLRRCNSINIQKVNEGLYNTLETANKIRADAEAEIRKIAEDNSILNEKITHKDNKVNEDRKKIEENQKKLSVL